MSDLQSRRDLLRTIGAALAAQGALNAQDTQHVHHTVMQAKAAGKYQPKALTAHEFATLQRLADLIIPADDRSPGALEAGAADFIDFLCAATDDMKDIYTGGLAWIDDQMRHRYDGKDFLEASASNQTAFLDLIAFHKNAWPELNPGIEFFSWARRMIADAYYTSPIGIKELGFMGNSAMTEFQVPKEAIEYALKRSPLG
jgi:hypothetical protein